MSVNLRAGVIGLGEMGHHHARVLSGIADIDLVALADPRCAGEERYGCTVFSDWRSLLDLRLDIAVIAVPTVLHEEVALAMAEGGVHTLIEKPLADSARACKEIAEAFTRRSLVGCVGHIERYNPALLALRERLSAGELGDVFQVATRRQGPYPTRVKDVGVVMDLATHDLDLTSWVTGQDYANVSARMNHLADKEHEDIVAVVGCLDRGIVVNHLVNWLSPMKERVAVVTGVKGCFVADTLTGDLTLFKNGVVSVDWETLAAFQGVVQGDMVRFAIPKREPLLVELEAFRDAVRGIRDEIVPLASGMQTVRVAQAVLESFERGGETVFLAPTERPVRA